MPSTRFAPRRVGRAGIVVAAAALALTGCLPSPSSPPATPPATPPSEPTSPPLAEHLEFVLDDVTVDVAVPGGGVLGDAANLAGVCADADEVASMSNDAGLLLALTSPETACPDVEPMNGQLPTWGSADQLPQEAEEVEAGDGVDAAYRLELTYAEYTNVETSWPTQVALLVLPDGRALQVVGFSVDAADFDAIVDGLVITET